MGTQGGEPASGGFSRLRQQLPSLIVAQGNDVERTYLMPYLGRRDSDYAEMGVSPDAPAVATNPLETRAAAVVARVAHDDDDRMMLLEALGLAPTVGALAAAS